MKKHHTTFVLLALFFTGLLVLWWADYAEIPDAEQRIRIEAFGQRLLRELPELDTRLQRDLDDGSEHRLRSIDNISRSKEPHSVDKPDHALLIAAQCDLVVAEPGR